MLSLNESVDALTRKLGDPPAAPDENGDSVFALADDLSLRLRALPDGRSLAWTEVAPPPARENEAEEKASEFLRLRLARLRNSGAAGVAAAADENGRLLLYAALAPETAETLLAGVTALLNEAEAMRRLMSGNASRAAASPPPGLFAGMADFFKK